MRILPLVSIILPTYNREDLLRRSVASARAQTYPNWELIVWDDGSTDRSAEVIRSFQDERIRYFYGDNHGAAYARNRAIENASGKYLAFLDSDDEWEREKLAEQVQILEAFDEIDLLFTDFLNIHVNDNDRRTSFEEHRKSLALLNTLQRTSRLHIIRSGIPQSLAVGNYIATDSILVRKYIFTRSQGFVEQLRNSEDFELWWRMSLSGARFAYLDRILMTRYKPAGSLSSSSLESCLSTLQAIELCKRAAYDAGRGDLVPHLDGLSRNTWQLMILHYGKAKNYPAMWGAFQQSLRYGFRPGTIRILLQGLLRY